MCPQSFGQTQILSAEKASSYVAGTSQILIAGFDSFGHAISDWLLRQLDERLKQVVRYQHAAMHSLQLMLVLDVQHIMTLFKFALAGFRPGRGL